MSNRTNTSEKKWIVVILILLSLCGTALCGWNLIRTFQSPLTLLGVLSNAIQFLSYLALLAFALYTNKLKGSAPFQGVVLAFAALLGIQLLQSGQAISGYGLSESLTLMINTFNLIAFANVIMVSNRLEKKRDATGYLVMAVILKLIGELILIINRHSAVFFRTWFLHNHSRSHPLHTGSDSVQYPDRPVIYS